MEQPKWLNRKMYPFSSHFFEIDGHKMHYIDEGKGEVILFVHGTPGWSFYYRNLITGLSDSYRCIAVDHLGFGFSDKPTGYDYSPEKMATNLKLFIEYLKEDSLHMVVHGYGGPIGLSYAVKEPDKIKKLVIMNTWMWSNKKNTTARRLSNFFGGKIGKVLFRYFNIAPNALLKEAWKNKKKLTREVHKHYKGPFYQKSARTAPWVLARELYGSNDWFNSLWKNKEAIKDKPVLILWGENDPAFKKGHLKSWDMLFSKAHIETFKGTGNFVLEEQPEHTLKLIRQFFNDEF